MRDIHLYSIIANLLYHFYYIMPGTGHSARYKGSISNRVRISPFQRLAEWNAQLLGADGAVPTITGGGGSLAFKKLDASDIDGVMTNPASTAGGGSLDMSSLDIFNVANITLSGQLKIDGANGLKISNNAASGSISRIGGNITIQSTEVSSAVQTAKLVLEALPSSGSCISLESSEVSSDIFIGHLAVASAGLGDIRTISIGTKGTPYNGGEKISIGTKAIAGLTNQINIGNTAARCRVNIRAGVNSLGGSSPGVYISSNDGSILKAAGTGTMSVGNSTTDMVDLTGIITHVQGMDRLNLISNDIGGTHPGVHIGNTVNSKIGFRGAIPIPQSFMHIGANLANPGATLSNVIDKVNLIINALVTVGLCQS